MRQLAMVAGVMALMPLLMGAGGNNPPIPGGTRIAGPTFNASVVMDPHNSGNTSTAKQATIRLYRDHNSAAGVFHIPDVNFPLAFGCDLTRTDQRFLFVTLINWIPEDVLNAMFDNLGVPRSGTFEPIITQILNDDCTPDPANLTTTDGGTDLPGILSFQATVRFLVPK
jgi:hypothetical protein